MDSGGGGGLVYIFYTDYPLFLFGRTACGRLLYNSAAFNCILLVIGGTLMYVLVGYGMGKLLAGFRRQSRQEAS